MAARFHGRGAHLRDAGRGAREGAETVESTGFGEWWGALAVIALAAVGVASLTGSTEAPIPAATPVDPTPRILEAITPSIQAIDEVEDAFASLCRAPVLLALELEPDCETGVITLSDDLFDGFGSAALSPIAQEDVRAAIRIYLSRLRDLPAIWNRLEGIELRGHSDPRAVRAPYVTNMVGSQQRPLGVLLFLVGENGLSDRDRGDFERLAVVSGASFSRPPESCPEESRECYPEWRRVEIRPLLSEARRREDWSRTLQNVRATARQIRQELAESER